MTPTNRRKFNSPWKHTEKDRGWTRRVERAKERGEYTPPKPVEGREAQKEPQP